MFELVLGNSPGWTSNDGNGNYAIGFGYDPYQRKADLYQNLIEANIDLPDNPALIDRLKKAGSLKDDNNGTAQSKINNLMEILLAQDFL